jgi:hypothetical protein
VAAGRAAACAVILVVGVLAWWGYPRTGGNQAATTPSAPPESTDLAPPAGSPLPTDAAAACGRLDALTVTPNRGSASYDRAAFGPDWSSLGSYPRLADGCTARDDVLKRDLTDLKTGDRNTCIVFSGTLQDPYTGQTLPYSRYSSSQIEIDHVVALGAAWRSGVRDWDSVPRVRFANDTANLMAVHKPANQDKSSKTPDRWRPRQADWCAYALRWIGVKSIYGLTVIAAERSALTDMLAACPA